MTLPIVLRDEAQAEFDEAFDWYEERSTGRGVKFAAAIQQVFDRMGVNAGSSPPDRDWHGAIAVVVYNMLG